MILVAADIQNSGTVLAWKLMCAENPGLAAIEQGIRLVEANETDWSVGRGGYPNAQGEVELDAGVMDGRNRASGAVAGLHGYLHPVSVAYEVMQRLPHVLLVGAGAAQFAEEVGAEKADLLTDTMRENLIKWQKSVGLNQPSTDLIGAVHRGMDPQHTGGTTVYLAQDSQGDIAVATSTSGWAWKYPGRVGDTPIAGAGFFADNRYGAAACTGRGEMAIRSGLARLTVALMQMGRTVEEAVSEALKDVFYLGDKRGEIHLYAIDTRGNHDVACIGPVRPAGNEHYYFVARDGDPEPGRQYPRHIDE
ncbi:MAG: isoaspartyl peptidase/L-asparaginase [Anaerolineae bacterium]|nr:isoaspartyl peptidase/L-asparaginase [Anaerolineae bacterium]